MPASARASHGSSCRGGVAGRGANGRPRYSRTRARTRSAPDSAARYASDDAVWHLLATRPRRQRPILSLQFYDDQSDAQIAAILGISASAVQAHTSRGIATLRARLVDSDTSGALS